MTNELFPFQQNAVGAHRQKASDAHRAYEMTRTPQVVSLQAPTGSGKTIMMAGRYDELAEKVRNFKLANRVFDAYSGAVQEGVERFIRLDLGKGEIREKVLAARNDDDLCALFDKYGFSLTKGVRNDD